MTPSCIEDAILNRSLEDPEILNQTILPFQNRLDF
jgi:hypothetical protein